MFAAVLVTVLTVALTHAPTAGAIDLAPVENQNPVTPPPDQGPAPEPGQPAPGQPAPNPPAADPGGSAPTSSSPGRRTGTRRPSGGTVDAPATDPAPTGVEAPSSGPSLPTRLLTPVKPARSIPSISIPTPEPFASVLAIAVLLLLAAAGGTAWAQVAGRFQVAVDDAIDATA